MLLPALCTTRSVLFLTIMALYLVDRLLPVGVEGLQRAVPLLRSRVMPLIPFRSVTLSLQINQYPFFPSLSGSSFGYHLSNRFKIDCNRRPVYVVIL